MKIKDNTDLIQSYVMTTAKYDFSVQEKRVLYRIIEVLQAKTKGLKLKYDYSMQEDLFGKTEFTLPIACFLAHENDTNYDPVKKALVRLRQKGFEYEDAENWGFYGIIELPQIKKGSSVVKFTVTPLLMKAFLNFSKGHRKYELKTAMSFESVYAMRFYELFSGKDAPITYRIEELKKMFGIENKYKGRPNSFISKVVVAAQKELNKHSPYSFKYEKIKTGKKITMITFKPFFIPKNRDESLEQKHLQKQISLRFDFNKETISYLKDVFAFDDKGIKNNQDLIKQAVASEKYRDWCVDINGMIRKYDIKNPTGFFINEIKKRLKENE
jgi:plasmid replication initiation protein